MSDIRTAFRQARAEGRIALVGYLPAGFPDPDAFGEVVEVAAKAGLDVLEIGLPAADARMDGQVIRTALQTMRRYGVDVDRALELGALALCRAECVGLAMLYADTLAEYGVERLLVRCARLGIPGLLPVGIDPEAGGELAQLARRHGVQMVGFITANADEQMMQAIIAQSSGFVYVQSNGGKTGERASLNEALRNRLARIRCLVAPSDLPIAVGFGIRSPEDVARVREMGADGAVVGTALVEAASQGTECMQSFVHSLAQAARQKE